jgi:DNA repair photolyase
MPRVYPVPSEALLVRQRESGFLAGFDFSLNPYCGCAFQCAGCYVPDLLFGRAERLGGWGSYVEARVRSVEVLRRRAPSLHGATFFMSPVSDVYQPAERRYRLTRGLLEALGSVPFDWGLLSTRSPLVLEDLDLLQELGDRIAVGISLPSDLEQVRRRMDPRNPPVAARLDACRRLREAGVPVRLHVAPLQPHSPDFPRIAGEVADRVWIDFPCHLRVARPAYEARAMGEYLSRRWVERQADRWREALGPDRVGFGQADFSRRPRAAG